ncbi:hypothetical protein OQA88_12121 [Cercophora sp. LCS_1]
MWFPSIPLVSLGLSLLASIPSVLAQNDIPLWVQGGLEGANATDTSYNTGGTIVVNGFTMTVPKNLLVQFPAAWVPFGDFVERLDDFIGFETLIIGNTVNNVPLVGQIVIYEFFESVSGGYIESLNYTEGTIQIHNGPVVRISDPNGVFSVGYSDHPFMTADDVSPSITSFSGFPMCIPRNTTDPLCPLSNRPASGAGIFVAPDQLVMAPFMPGDFITFSGFRRKGTNEVVAFSIVALNVQIQTTGNIVYVRMELGLLGIVSPSPIAEIPESRFIGFVSNALASVTLYAMDVDPCTGETNDRIIATVGLRGGANAQMKFRYRNDILSGYTREYRATAEIQGVPKTVVTKNGLVAGTYVQPVNVWIPAELGIPGAQPITHEFIGMDHLAKGVGKDALGRHWGALDPFPQSGVTLPMVVCEEEQEEEEEGPTHGTGTIQGPEFEGRKLKKRFGGRHAYNPERAAAVESGQDKNTTEGTVKVAPAEAAAIAEKEAEEDLKFELEDSLELGVEVPSDAVDFEAPSNL